MNDLQFAGRYERVPIKYSAQHSNLRQKSVVSEVFTAVVMKSSIFRTTTPCSQLKVNRRLGDTCCLRLQGLRNTPSKLCLSRASLRFLACLILRRSLSRYVLLKRRLTFSGLHSLVSHKVKLFICHAGHTR
jgi:hypothetical protein